MDIWHETLEAIIKHKETFRKSYKCINKSVPISPQTVKKHLEVLTSSINKIRILLLTYERNFTEENKIQAREIYDDQIGKFKFILQKYNIFQNISNDYSVKITLDLDNFENNFDNNNSDEMAQTVAQFLSNASKILPEFDGKAESLQSFIDAIELLELIKDTHETVAVNLVKTKLKGASRNLITNETTLQQIIARLKASVKGESVEVLTAKILNIKQHGKAANVYTKEIEDLTKSLENAYISDGISAELSTKYSTQTAVKAMARNCSSDRVKLIMEAGSFSNMNEAVSKFVSSCTEATGTQNTILFTNKRGYNYNRGHSHRGHSRGRGNQNNFNPYYNPQNRQNSYNRRGRGNNRGYNHANNNNASSSNNRNIRLTSSEPPQENENLPLRN